MTMQRQKVIRVQLDMLENRIKELEDIMATTGVSTRKDLFENALTFFEWAVNQRKKGRKIASVDENEESFQELLMPALASVKHEAETRNSFKKEKT